MIDDNTAILDVLTQALSAPPPAIVRSIMTFGGGRDYEILKNDLAESTKEAQRNLYKWLADGKKGRKNLRKAFSVQEITQQNIETLTYVINAIEEDANKRAKDHIHQHKRMKKYEKQLKAESPPAARLVTECLNAFDEIRRAEIDELTTLALFLRALRADHSPDAKGGPSFSDSDQLEKYLRQASS